MVKRKFGQKSKSLKYYVKNTMTMIAAGLALTLTLDTHSQAESETLPHVLIIKTLCEVLTTKQCDMVSGSTFNL